MTMKVFWVGAGPVEGRLDDPILLVDATTVAAFYRKLREHKSKYKKKISPEDCLLYNFIIPIIIDND